jgi:hypothetical protein
LAAGLRTIVVECAFDRREYRFVAGCVLVLIRVVAKPHVMTARVCGVLHGVDVVHGTGNSSAEILRRNPIPKGTLRQAARMKEQLIVVPAKGPLTIDLRSISDAGDADVLIVLAQFDLEQ